MSFFFKTINFSAIENLTLIETDKSWLIYSNIISLFLTVMFIIFLGIILINNAKHVKFLNLISAFYLTIFLLNTSLNYAYDFLNLNLSVNQNTTYFVNLFIFIATLTTILFFLGISNVFFIEENSKIEFSFLIWFIYISAIFLISSTDFISIIILLECIAFCSYVLVGFERKNKFSTTSALKYLILASVPSGFFILGVALLYNNFGSFSQDYLTLILQALTNINIFEISETDINFKHFWISIVESCYHSTNSHILEIFEYHPVSIFFKFYDYLNNLDALCWILNYSVEEDIQNILKHLSFLKDEYFETKNRSFYTEYILLETVLKFKVDWITLVFAELLYLTQIYDLMMIALADEGVIEKMSKGGIWFPIPENHNQLWTFLKTNGQFVHIYYWFVTAANVNFDYLDNTALQFSDASVGLRYARASNYLTEPILSNFARETLYAYGYTDANIAALAMKIQNCISSVLGSYNLTTNRYDYPQNVTFDELYFIRDFILDNFENMENQRFDLLTTFSGSLSLLFGMVAHTGNSEAFSTLITSTSTVFERLNMLSFQNANLDLNASIVSFLGTEYDLLHWQTSDNTIFSYINVAKANLYYTDSFLIIYLVLLFLLMNLSFKLTAAPFHLWAPSVYGGSPLATLTFLSIFSKLTILFFTIWLFLNTFDSLKTIWQSILLIISFLSILCSVLGAFSEKVFKRFFVYSSIGHVGFMLIGILVLNIDGIKGTIDYLILYIVSSFLIWFILLHLSKKTATLVNLKGLSFNQPMLSLIFSITIFSLSGIPPFGGFFVKYEIFYSIINSSFFYFAYILLLLTVVSFFYYLRLIKIIFFEQNKVFIKNKNIDDIKLRLIAQCFFIIPFFMLFMGNPIINFIKEILYKSLF